MGFLFLFIAIIFFIISLFKSKNKKEVFIKLTSFIISFFLFRSKYSMYFWPHYGDVYSEVDVLAEHIYILCVPIIVYKLSKCILRFLFLREQEGWSDEIRGFQLIMYCIMALVFFQYIFVASVHCVRGANVLCAFHGSYDYYITYVYIPLILFFVSLYRPKRLTVGLPFFILRIAFYVYFLIYATNYYKVSYKNSEMVQGEFDAGIMY